MANRAYLLTVDDRSVTWSKNPKSEILAEGINEIPVFWASLFSKDDRQIDKYPTEAGNNLEVANWCSDAETAKDRLRSLREPIAKLLDRRSCSLWDQWVEFLTAQQCQFFKTNAVEIWDLDPQYEQNWHVLLRAFENPSAATWEAACDRNELEYTDGHVNWDDEEMVVCKLAGADHLRDLPWID